MTYRKPLKIVLGLLILFAVVVGLTSIKHPIILKWMTGSAKHHGKPMPAKVFSNGQVDNHIKIFYTDEPNNYLISMPEYDNLEMVNFLNIDLNKKLIGKPMYISKEDYDFIGGHLFQSETGSNFSPFQEGTKGFNFDPQLTYTGKQIKFNMPPNYSMIDSVKIILP